MEYRTKEMTIILSSDNIIEAKFNEGITGLTIEGADENLKVFSDINAMDSSPKGALTTMPSFYVTKDIIKKYTVSKVLIPVALGLITTSFSSKLMGNLYLTLKNRFWPTKADDYPVRIFDKREDALEWVKGHLVKIKEEKSASYS